MRRDQLEHAIRTACEIIGAPAVIIVGSQSVLGTFDEQRLPAEATMSIEVDILPIAEDNHETARLADLIEGVAGEFSPFEQLHGSASTASISTPAPSPPAGATAWSKSRTPIPPPPSGEPQFTGWCLDKEDLCAAKLCAFREKDQNFVAALLQADLINLDTVIERLTLVGERHREAARMATSRLRSWA